MKMNDVEKVLSMKVEFIWWKMKIFSFRKVRFQRLIAIYQVQEEEASLLTTKRNLRLELCTH